MFILTNAKETCRYVPSANKFLLGGVTSGSQTIASALSQSSGDSLIDQYPCEVTIRYLDQSYSTLYEVIRGVYNAADNSITRVSTTSSTTGTGLINFDETSGADNLVIYGTTSHSAFGVVTLQEGILQSSADYVTTTVASDTDMSSQLLVTRTNPKSSLIVSYSTNAWLSRTSSAADDMRGSARGYFWNGSSWAANGPLRLIGSVSTGVNNSGTDYGLLALTSILPPADTNGSGQWQWRVRGRVDFPDNNLQFSDSQIHWKEVLGAS